MDRISVPTALKNAVGACFLAREKKDFFEFKANIISIAFFGAYISR